MGMARHARRLWTSVSAGTHTAYWRPLERRNTTKERGAALCAENKAKGNARQVHGNMKWRSARQQEGREGREEGTRCNGGGRQGPTRSEHQGQQVWRLQQPAGGSGPKPAPASRQRFHAPAGPPAASRRNGGRRQGPQQQQRQGQQQQQQGQQRGQEKRAGGHEQQPAGGSLQPKPQVSSHRRRGGSPPAASRPLGP